MLLKQSDITAAKVGPITDWVKDLTWGTAPFPAGFVPILAVTNAGNPAFGVLLRASATGRFVIGTSGSLRSLSDDFAIQLINKAEFDDTSWSTGTWGGAREGAGRPKEVPEEAKRRSIYLTDEEFRTVKEWLALYRENREEELK